MYQMSSDTSKIDGVRTSADEQSAETNQSSPLELFRSRSREGYRILKKMEKVL